ncbi:MAG: serine/threonine-protein kinase [Planctomycetota bacterium]
MTALPPTMFEQALAASGLVPEDRLAAARAAARGDDELSHALIEAGLLNAWQVDQLAQGRTKFSLGPYQILDSIGRGGMGHVFKCRHALLDRVEAVKVLPRERTRGDAIKSFLREVRAQADLDHPNVVRVTYADRDGDTYYLVTEYVPGIDLRRLIRRAGPLPIDLAALVVLDVCDALEYAHHRGLVHRDIKPGNVLITPGGDVKLTDLGLAWRLDDPPDADPNLERRIVGTCDYLAPEAIQQPASIMPVSDVYALGCTLYYAVTGKVPYPGGNTRDKLRRVVRDEPIDPLALRPDLPTELVTLLGEMMARRHEDRTPSAAAAAEKLRPFLKPGSRQHAGEYVRRHQSAGAAGGGEGRHNENSDGSTPAAGEQDTIDEPLLDDGLEPPTMPEGPRSAGPQTANSIGPGLTDHASDQDGRAPLDRAVWATVAIGLIATAGLIVSALLRSG